MKIIAALLIFSACLAQAQERVPTLVVDVQFAGPQTLSAWKRAEGVLWSIEFGSEMLLGVTPAASARLQSLPGAQIGPGAIAREELLIRGHVCAHAAQIPTWAVVGGYELLRVPVALAKMQAIIDPSLQLVPEDGVFARAQATKSIPRALLRRSPTRRHWSHAWMPSVGFKP
jgi:hypothetical protein